MTDEFKPFYEEVEQIRDSLVGRPRWPTTLPMPPTAEDWPVQTEEEHLSEIRDQVYAHLREQKAPPTCRNIIHAMFAMHYADWIGYDDCIPTCPYEHQGE